MDQTDRKLSLQANDRGWRLFLLRRDDPSFEQFKQKVLKRDHYTCYYCNFVSTQHMEVVNIDGNYSKNKMANMATACPYCTQCHFIQAIGDHGFGGGVLIHLPQLTQIQLNALCHALFSDLVNSPARYTNSKSVYRELKLLAQPVEKKLGEGMSSPSLYGQLLIENASEKMDAFNENLMATIRLLPRLEKFTTFIQDYALEAYRELSQ
jgi:intracellular multiplication protein IcmJ